MVDVSPEMQEFVRCKMDFSYFCANYVRIFSPTEGMVPFRLYGFQRGVVQDYEDYRFNIIRKFRQGGISTTTAVYCLWRALFFTDQQSFVVSISDREAMNFHKIIRRAYDSLPEFIKGQPIVENQHELILETGGSIQCYTPKAGRGFSTGLLIIDEAAFIPEMGDFWGRVYPTVSTGGKAIVISTVNGMGNWYHQTWVGAENGTNKFHPVRLHYTDHPSYRDPQWVEDTRAQLGEKRWAQEVLGEFLGSSNTYIEAKTIEDIASKCSEPISKRLDGSLWVWEEPHPEGTYIIGADTSEGLGPDEEGEFSCAQVVDLNSHKQVAEFYSNEYPPRRFAQMLSKLAEEYNMATLVVENNSLGVSVLEYLESDIHYPNLYHHSPVDSTGKKAKRGLNTNKKTRGQIQEVLYETISNQIVGIRSRRLANELRTWVFNPNKKRAEHLRGYYDDAITALGFSLFVRSDILRNSTPFLDLQNSDLEGAEPVYHIDDDIEKEFSQRDEDEEPAAGLLEPEVQYSVTDDDSILKEFGWA